MHNEAMENLFSQLVKELGEDLTREGLVDTPKRAAAAFRYLNSGYHMSLDKVLNKYGVELNNNNYGLAGKTLTSLRKEMGHGEMAILEKMLTAETNGETFDDAARRVSTSMN